MPVRLSCASFTCNGLPARDKRSVAESLFMVLFCLAFVFMSGVITLRPCDASAHSLLASTFSSQQSPSISFKSVQKLYTCDTLHLLYVAFTTSQTLYL